MTITYELGNSLYVNVTNRCSNSCEFCVRDNHDGITDRDNLWLDREPTVDEIKADFEKRDLSKYDSVVFCGFGEPFMRFDDCITVAKWLREKHPSLNIRVNTNGQANLIEKKDVTPQLKGLFDCVSISLNAPNAERYDKMCHSCFGKDAYDALLDFAEKAAKYVPKVVLSIVDHDITAEEIDVCRKIAELRGVSFRVREYIE